MSKYLNLTPMVFRGKGGELLHTPCALLKSTFLQKSDFDYWDIDGSLVDVERAFEKLKIHYSSVIPDEIKPSSNPRWKWNWITANLKELGVFNWSQEDGGMEEVEIIEDGGGGSPLEYAYDGMSYLRGTRQVFRCTPPGGEIPEGLFSDQELNFPNMHPKAVPFTEEEITVSSKGPYHQGWTVDENWVIDEEDEEIEDLKEQIIQLQKSNDEMKKMLNLLLKSSDTHNITYNIQDSAISGNFNIDDNPD